MTIKEQLQQPPRLKEITGHDLMDITRFMDDTRHMIVFDVLEWECPVEEINLAAIYKAETKAATLSKIAAALPLIGAEMQTLAKNAGWKLAALTEQEYSALTFAPADETEG